MGSTGEPDRKRRHFSPVSPTGAAVAAARRQQSFPCSEDRKLDVAVLQFQNQKLSQQLEAQKVEFFALENKFHQVKVKQKIHNDTVVVVNDSWERLVGDLESQSVSSGRFTDDGNDLRSSHTLEDGASCSLEDDCLDRLLETGATESCSNYVSASGEVQVDAQTIRSMTKNILGNILTSLNSMWHSNNEDSNALFATLPEDDSSRQLQNIVNGVQQEVRMFRVAVGELHLKHRQLSDKVQIFRDNAAKDKSEHRRLSVELATTVADLEENKQKLATLKGQKDAAKGVPISFPTLGNKHGGADKLRDKHREVQDLESLLKDFTKLISSRLVEIMSVHEERLDIFKKLAFFQNALMDTKSLSSTRTFQLLSDQLAKSKAEMDKCRVSLEKLQMEKDNLVWHEKELSIKVELADGPQKVFAFLESRIDELDQQWKRLVDERIFMDTRLEAASRKPCMKEIVAEFEAMLSSLPKRTGIMQSELCKYKEASSELNSMRAAVQSLSSRMVRKANEMESLSDRSTHACDELKKLRAVIHDLGESDQELKLFLEMYRREPTDTWDVIECRDMEFSAWAQVHTLKASLDEHRLELRVKAANEDEATSQQQLATAEAEIAELRQKLDVSGRNIRKLSETLKSKHEEGETYLSEIESIGQAYIEMQTQNQHLLHQITERDDYNTKLVMDGVKARHLETGLCREIEIMDKKIKHANSLMDLYNQKVVWLEDQLKLWSEQVGKLAEDGRQASADLESTQRRILDLQRECRRIVESFDEAQVRVERSGLDATELQIELEKARFSKRRTEEELELMSRKTTHRKGHTDKSAIMEKLQQEVGEYRGILKCSICHDRQKEVVVAKCYHLFCNQCVQRALGSRHRKCPTCGTGFGPNDVKPIYI